MATETTIRDRGYQHFESLQMSAQEFYLSLENLIKEYQYPNVTCKVGAMKEGGLLSAKRKYLEISWERHTYYVCASPFGKSFFISWWHKENANTGAQIASKFGALGRSVANKMETKSYYELDSENMFISCVTSIINLAIDKVKADKGFTVEHPEKIN